MNALSGTLRVRRLLGVGLVAIGLSGCAASQGHAPLRSNAPRDLWTRARDLLVRAVQSDDPVVRAHAIEALVNVAPDDGRPFFQAATDDLAPLVRFAACMAVGDLRDRAARNGVERLLDDPEPRVRLAAAYAAYRLGDRERASVLVKALTSSSDEDTRCEAAHLIGKCGDARAIERLRLAGKRERGPKASVHIVAAMAMLGDRRARDEIIRNALGSEPIAKLLSLQTLIELRDEAARDALLYRLREEGDYVEVRLLAARALGRLGVKAGYPLALKSLHYEGEKAVDTTRVRSLAALALGAIGDKRALSRLKQLAADQSDPNVQVAACYAICEILNGR